MMSQNRSAIIITAVVAGLVIITALIALWAWSLSGATNKAAPATVAASSTLGGSIYNQIQAARAKQEAQASAPPVPQTNPLQNAANPFDHTYQNPFNN